MLIITLGTVFRDKPDWTGYALAIGSLCTVIGVALWGKNKGKEQEGTP